MSREMENGGLSYGINHGITRVKITTQRQGGDLRISGELKI